MGACVTPRSTSPSLNPPFFKDRLADQRASEEEVETARRLLETDDAAVAIPRLVHVISKYPGSPAAAEAHYWLGVAYYKMQGYRDAINMFRAYQELAPEGRYAAESEAYIAKVSDVYAKIYDTPDELNQRIDDVTARLAQDPNNGELRLELADLLWRRGDYVKAAEIYAGLVAEQPNFGADATLASRIEFLPNGTYVILTPEEVQRRAIEAEPLRVVNTTAFKSGRDLLTRERKFYVVTGQVRNRSDSILYGVQVIVTLYGFGNVVYDTNTVNIGRMNPDEVRAFTVRFSNFPNIDDINRHEVVPVFQR